ncbi:hypothetical protein MVEN_02277700 [Mycena venus]|uniref:Uncharacterized protein n=1 Tax=Mycena venus TaxID=2733690 RepID=A0A8H7CFX5_9AGAR|nr:hypothetical protein MVEN_02277700 [Mycena venus]
MLNSALTYVDLLRGPTGGLTASWDPEITVRVGDYGRVTQGQRNWIFFWRKNGTRFLKEGNIYTDGKAAEHGIPEPIENGGDSEGEAWVTSENATRIDASLFGGTLAQCEVKGAFKFSSGRGAVLAQKNTMITSIEAPAALKRVLEDPSMRGFCIVSEVHSCSAYARWLTTIRGGAIALGLRIEPSGFASVGATATWVKSATSGNFKSHVNKSGERLFYPLYRLVSLSEEGTLT